MRISYKKLAVWVIIAAAVAVFFMQPYTETTSVSHEIKTIDNTCVFDDYQEQDISVVGDSVVMTVPIRTPTPCYYADGSVTVSGTDIRVNIEAFESNDECTAECVGIVVSETTVSGLKTGEYDLKINTPDSVLINTVKIR